MRVALGRAQALVRGVEAVGEGEGIRERDE